MSASELFERADALDDEQRHDEALVVLDALVVRFADDPPPARLDGAADRDVRGAVAAARRRARRGSVRASHLL